MTHRSFTCLLLAGAALLVSHGVVSRGLAQTTPAPRPRESSSAFPPSSATVGNKREIVLNRCLVRSTDPIKLPAREAGSIMEIAVKRGAEIKAGDIVGQVDDSDAITKKEIAERERDAAQAKAESPHELQAARDGERVASENYKANVELNKSGQRAVSLFDLRRSEFEWLRSKAQIGVAETEQVVARHTQFAKQAQIVAAENEIERRKLRSPVDGVVIQLYKHVGDWAQPGDAVMEIVRMNRVEIEGKVLALEASPSEVYGKPVTIYVDLAGPSNQDKPFIVKGHITFASQVMDGSGSNREFSVSTEVENTQIDGFWVIQPGSQAKMVIDLTPPALSRPLPGTPKITPASTKPLKVEAQKPVLDSSSDKAAAPKAELKSESKPAVKTEPSTKAAPAAKTEPAPKSDASSEIIAPRVYGSRTTPKTEPKAEPKADSKTEPAKKDR